ncbi:MAG: hypothetical protein P8Y07_10695 [Gemmatimonadales bacterium]
MSYWSLGWRSRPRSDATNRLVAMLLHQGEYGAADGKDDETENETVGEV